MRHVWTLIAAVLIAPLAWVLLAYGQDRSIQAFVNEEAAGTFDNGDFTRPVLCLAAAGLLLGLLGTLRFSPAGAVLTGVVYTAGYAALLAAPDTVLGLVPGEISLAGREANLETPLRTGSAMVLGAALLLAVVSVGRWRRAAQPEDALPAAPRPDERPLGAEGLGLATAPAPATGEVLTGDLDAASGTGWGGRQPVAPGWANERAEATLHGEERDSRWRDLARDSGPESRRWPTAR